MDDMERELRRAGQQWKRQAKLLNSAGSSRGPKSADPNAVERRLRNIKRATGLDIRVCVVCGSTDVSNFELDHIAGRKNDQSVWPICRPCHERKTDMIYEDPPLAEDPQNALAVIANWLLGIAGYIEIGIEFLQTLPEKLRAFARVLIDAANEGHGKGIILSS